MTDMNEPTESTELQDIIDSLSVEDRVMLHNELCDLKGYNDVWYRMEDFEEMLAGTEPMELACRIYYGDFCPNHDYFTFNCYANLVSSDFPDVEIDKEDVREYYERLDNVPEEIVEYFENLDDDEE